MNRPNEDGAYTQAISTEHSAGRKATEPVQSLQATHSSAPDPP